MGGNPSVIRAKTETTPIAPRQASAASDARIARAIQRAAEGAVRGSASRAGGDDGGASYPWDSERNDGAKDAIAGPGGQARRRFVGYDGIATRAVALQRSRSARARSALWRSASWEPASR